MIPYFLNDSVKVSDLNTGDMIFFHGEGNFGSTIIEMSGMSPWSHVALYVEYQTEDGVIHPAIWEATSWHANQYELVKHQLRGGARIVDLNERLLLTKPGSIGVRSLEANVQYRKDLKTRINRFIGSEDGKPYENSWWPLIRSWFDVFDDITCLPTCFGRNRVDTSAYFCSELVAETLMQANVLRFVIQKPSDEFTVADMARLTDADLVSPYHYAPIKQLEWPIP